MISRAQKYKIKSKMPYKLLQKSFIHLYNINILVKTSEINQLSQLQVNSNRSKQGIKQTGKGQIQGNKAV